MTNSEFQFFLHFTGKKIRRFSWNWAKRAPSRSWIWHFEHPLTVSTWWPDGVLRLFFLHWYQVFFTAKQSDRSMWVVSSLLYRFVIREENILDVRSSVRLYGLGYFLSWESCTVCAILVLARLFFWKLEIDPPEN